MSDALQDVEPEADTESTGAIIITGSKVLSFCSRHGN